MLSCNLIFLFGREIVVALMSWSRTAKNSLKNPYDLDIAISVRKLCIPQSTAPSHSWGPAYLCDAVSLFVLPKGQYQTFWTHSASPAFPFTLLNGVWHGVDWEVAVREGTVQHSVSKWQQHEWWQQNLQRTLKITWLQGDSDELTAVCLLQLHDELWWIGVTA